MTVAQIRIGGLNAPSGVYQLRLNFNGSKKWDGELSTLGGSFYYAHWDTAVVTLDKIKSSKPTAELQSESGELGIELNDAPNLQWLDELLAEQSGPIFREHLEQARIDGLLVHAILARYDDVTVPPAEFVFAGSMSPSAYSVAHRVVNNTSRRYDTVKCTFSPAERLDVPLSEIEWEEADMFGQREFIAAITTEPDDIGHWYVEAGWGLSPESIVNRIIGDDDGDGTPDWPYVGYAHPPLFLTHIASYGCTPRGRNTAAILDPVGNARTFPAGNHAVRMSTVVQKVSDVAGIAWDGNLNRSITMPRAVWSENNVLGHYDEIGETVDPLLNFQLAFGFNWYTGETFKSPATWDTEMTVLDVLRGIAIQNGCWVSLTDGFDADGLPLLKFMPIDASGSAMPALNPLPDSSEDVPISDSDGVKVSRRGFDGAIIAPANAQNPVEIVVPFGVHAMGYNSAPAFDVSRMTLNANIDFKSQWKCGQRAALDAPYDGSALNPDGWVLGSLLFDYNETIISPENSRFPEWLGRSGDSPYPLIHYHDDAEECYQAAGWNQYYVVHAAYESATLTDREKRLRQEHPLLAWAMLFGRAIRGERKQLQKNFAGVVAPLWTDIALAQTYQFTPVLDAITYRIVSIERDIIGDEISVLFEEVAPPIVRNLSWRVEGKEGGGNGSIGANGADGTTGADGGVARWKNLIVPAITTATKDNWTIGQSGSTVAQISSTVNTVLSGVTGGVEGDWLVLHNIGTKFISLANNSVSTSVNRFKFGGSGIQIGPLGSVGCWYDGTIWKVMWTH